MNEINIAPVLDPVGDQAIDEETLLTFTATAGDVDLPANGLTFTLEGAPPVGAVINPVTGVFTWTPTEGQGPGVYPITVRVTDDGSGLLWDEETITVTVTEVNIAPVLDPVGDQTVDEETLLTFTATGSDVDVPANTLTFTMVGAPPAGALVDPVTGVLTWTPTEGQGPGVYPITVRVTDDGVPNLFDEETITVTVGEVNITPILDPVGDQAIDEQALLTFTATASDVDVPANTLTFTIVGARPAGAVIDPVTGVFTWTPTEAQGPDTYTITIRVTDDGTGLLFDSETITVTVSEVDTTPTLDAVGDHTVDEQTLLSFTATASDADIPDSLTFGLVGAPAGAVIDPATGEFAWTPTEAQGPGAYVFDVVVTDTMALLAAETITITVNEVNTAPVLDDPSDQVHSIGADVALTVTASDVDEPANSLTFTATDLPDGLALNAISGEITGTTTAGGIYPVEITVTDDGIPVLSDSVTFTWTVNLAPVAAADAFTMTIGETTTIASPGVLGNDSDPDDDALTAILVTPPSRGTLTLNEDGSFSYSHNGVDKTTDSFRYYASDGDLNSEVVTVTLTITGNRAPTPQDDEVTLDEDTSVVFDPLINDDDPDGDSLTYEIADRPLNGRVTPDPAGGGLVYTPEPDWNGIDTMTYRTADGLGGFTEATISLIVRPVNDPPTAVDLAEETEAGDPVVIDLLAAADDIDGDELLIGLGAASHGELTLGRGGIVTYVSQAGYDGIDTFTYTVVDGNGGAVTHLVTIDVHGVSAVTIGVPALVGYAEAPAIITPSELDEVSIPGIDLLFGSAFQSFNLLQTPLLALALAFGLSLMIGLSRGLIFGGGAVYLPPIKPGRSSVVFIGQSDKLPVRDDVGDRHEIIYEFAPAERDLRTTGRRAQLGTQRWVEVESPEGDGWVSAFHLTRQVPATEFSNDHAAVDMANKLATIIEARGNIGLVTGDRGLHIAHFAPPEHIGLEEIPTLVTDDSVWAWWGPSGSIPEVEGSFHEVVGRSFRSTLGRYEPRVNAESHYPAPVELVNFHSVTFSDSELPGKDAWRVFYDSTGDGLVIAALWKEHLPNPEALGSRATRRLLVSG